GPFKVGFYLSTVQVAGPPGTFIGSVNVNGIAAGATVSTSATVVVPTSVAAGVYYLSALADIEDRVAEANDGNNGAIAVNQITIRRPDLVMTKVTGPSGGVGAVGQPLAVALSVKNQGLPPANAGPFKIGVYLSTTQNPLDGTRIGKVSVAGAVAGAPP